MVNYKLFNMRKIIALWVVAVCSFGAFAQTVIKDTLWIEDFDDGIIDYNVFPDIAQYSPVIKNSTFPEGYQALSLTLENGFCGPLAFPFHADYIGL